MDLLVAVAEITRTSAPKPDTPYMRMDTYRWKRTAASESFDTAEPKGVPEHGRDTFIIRTTLGHGRRDPHRRDGRTAIHTMPRSHRQPQVHVLTATPKSLLLRFRQNLLAAAHLPDQCPKHHKNPNQRRGRFDPVEQRTLNGRTLEAASEVAQAQ